LWIGSFRGSEHAVKNSHPTQKPVAVMVWCMGAAHIPQGTILDPYMGSGTTGVACVLTGRKFIGIEINETYFYGACRRIESRMKSPEFFLRADSEQE
jgi:DNA modification methylase